MCDEILLLFSNFWVEKEHGPPPQNQEQKNVCLAIGDGRSHDLPCLSGMINMYFFYFSGFISAHMRKAVEQQYPGQDVQGMVSFQCLHNASTNHSFVSSFASGFLYNNRWIL